MSKRLKIVFFGTPEFAVESLDRIIRDGHDVAAVVTPPDKPAGRGHKLLQSDVKKYALEKGIPVLQPEKLRDPDFIEELRSLNADVFTVIAFRMLPEVVWSMPPMGTFNLHGSLLPRYRGAAPINRAVMNGDAETGVTTFFLSHDIDTGNIIFRERLPIAPDENAGSVHDRMMTLGAKVVSRTLEAIAEGTAPSLPQNEEEACPAPKIFREDCRIDWALTARHIHNHIRGLAPYPCAWSTLEEQTGKPVETKILKAIISTDDISGATPGEIRILDGRMLAKCGQGTIEILSLKPAGKKEMEASAFLRGYSPLRFKD